MLLNSFEIRTVSACEIFCIFHEWKNLSGNERVTYISECISPYPTIDTCILYHFMSTKRSPDTINLEARVDSLAQELEYLRNAVKAKQKLLQSLAGRISDCENLAGIGVDYSFAYPYPSASGSVNSATSGMLGRRARGDSGDTQDTDSALMPMVSGGANGLEYKQTLGSDAAFDYDDGTSSGSPAKRPRSTNGSSGRKNNHKFCTFEGCHKMAHGPTYLFCLRHGGGYRCQAPGCTRSAYSTKYCSRHGGGPRCQWEGCSKGAISNSSYCRRHGGGSRCQHPNCPEGARQGFNFCLNHGGFNPCAYPNCPGIALLTANYCRQHNAVFKTGGTKAE